MASCLKEILHLTVSALLFSSVFAESAEPEISNPPGQFAALRQYVNPEGTTPAICPNATRCGFQLYDKETRSTRYSPYIKYCECPEGTSCEQDGESMNMGFYWYLCKNVTEATTTESMSTEGKDLLYGTDEVDSEDLRRFSSRAGSLATRTEL